MSEILRVALASIVANPFRAVLTMLGVVIGVGSVITMLALGHGAQRAVDEQLAALGANVITVTTGMRFAQGVARDQQLLTIDDARALADEGDEAVRQDEPRPGGQCRNRRCRRGLGMGRRHQRRGDGAQNDAPHDAEAHGGIIPAGRSADFASVVLSFAKTSSAEQVVDLLPVSGHNLGS